MTVRILRGHVLDRLRELPDESVHCCVTSPPYYGLRDYGVPGQLGLEPTLDEYIAKMVEVFREVRRVLRSDGTLWLNIGDSYANDGKWGGSSGGKHVTELHGATGIGRGKVNTGLKPKDLMGVPWRLAFALQADGWYLRSDIIWHKCSAMPESVRDRPTKSHEHIFLLAKSESYYYDQAAASEPVEPDTIPRYYRGRSDDHKNADGGPGDQTINRSFAHMVGIGHNERERKAVPNVKRSGNKERKPASARGVPVDTDGSTNGAVAGAIPWEGSTRNWRDVWSLGPEPFKGAHFATFPTEIPRRAIVAGTSEKGCCASCGAPWMRVSGRPCEKCGEFIPFQGKSCAACGHIRDWKAERGVSVELNASEWSKPGRSVPRKLGESGKQGAVPPQERFVKDWCPSCECGTTAISPAVVLDPFLGSGTTALVADQLQRDAIGIELNPEYADMAERRIRSASPLFSEVSA